MYYRNLRRLYRDRGTGRTHEKIAQALDTSGTYAKKCLSTGCFSIDDKRLILDDLGLEYDAADRIFPVLGEE